MFGSSSRDWPAGIIRAWKSLLVCYEWCVRGWKNNFVQLPFAGCAAWNECPRSTQEFPTTDHWSSIPSGSPHPSPRFRDGEKRVVREDWTVSPRSLCRVQNVKQPPSSPPYISLLTLLLNFGHSLGSAGRDRNKYIEIRVSRIFCAIGPPMLRIWICFIHEPQFHRGKWKS